MATTSEAILQILKDQHESIKQIEKELIIVRGDQKICAEKLARWDGGLRGILVSIAAAAGGLTLWFRFKSS